MPPVSLTFAVYDLIHLLLRGHVRGVIQSRAARSYSTVARHEINDLFLTVGHCATQRDKLYLSILRAHLHVVLVVISLRLVHD